MNIKPIYADCPYYSAPKDTASTEETNGVGEWLFDRGLCLPSGSSLDDNEIDIVINALKEVLETK